MFRTRYSGVAVLLHWLIAAAILYNLYVAEFVWSDAVDPARSSIELHKSLGLTVLGLAVLRLLWRFSHQPPALLPAKRWEHKLATGTHHTLYLLMFLVPLAGWLHDSAWKAAASHPLVLYGVVPFFRLPGFAGMADATKDQWHDWFMAAHSIGAKLLIAALILHLAGALKHQFVDRQPEFRRMWFGRN